MAPLDSPVSSSTSTPTASTATVTGDGAPTTPDAPPLATAATVPSSTSPDDDSTSGGSSSDDGTSQDSASWHWALPVAIGFGALLVLLSAWRLATRKSHLHQPEPSPTRQAAGRAPVSNPSFEPTPKHNDALTMPSVPAPGPAYAQPHAGAGDTDHPGMTKDGDGYIQGHQIVAAPGVYTEPVPVSPGQEALDGYLEVEGGGAAAEPRVAAGKKGIQSRRDRKPSLYDGFGDDSAAAEANYGLHGQPKTSNQTCSYTAARDGWQCQSLAAMWSNQCTIHTCGRTGCSQPTSSRVEHCAEHAGASQSTA